MEISITTDLIRAAHLGAMALGMGTAIYFDLRSLDKLKQRFSPSDLAELHRIHTVVTGACIVLWLTGVTLIGLRTQFDISAFTPKLWAKMIVVTTLTLNAVWLGKWVIPAFKACVGQRIIELPIRTLVPMTVCAGVSFSSWVMALLLGSSAVLRTSGWDILVPFLAGGYLIGTCAVVVVMLVGRSLATQSRSQTPA